MYSAQYFIHKFTKKAYTAMSIITALFRITPN